MPSLFTLFELGSVIQIFQTLEEGGISREEAEPVELGAHDT